MYAGTPPSLSKRKGYTDLQLEEIYEKLHQERQCVTSKFISLYFGVSRIVASDMLEALLRLHSERNCSYEVTRCYWTQSKDKKSIAVLKKTRFEANLDSPHLMGGGKSGILPKIFSVAVLSHDSKGEGLEMAASVKSGHDHAIGLLRNTLHDANLGQAEDPSVLEPQLMCTINPSFPVQKLDRKISRMIRVKSISVDYIENQKKFPAKKAPISSSLSLSQKKTIAPVSFFTPSKIIDKTSSSKLRSSKPTMKNECSKAEADEGLKSRRNDSVCKNKKEVTRGFSTEPFKLNLNDSLKKGNADDFVGDEDEDEEFLREEEERKRRNATSAQEVVQEVAKQESKIEATRLMQKRAPSTDYEMEMQKNTKNKKVKKDSIVVGAIDSFTCMSQNSHRPDLSNERNNNSRKRKRILEEKTFVDENGYLQTETVHVWKDVSDTEENKQTKEQDEMVNRNMKSNTRNKMKVRDTKKMKQQGLKGFFVKKK